MKLHNYMVSAEESQLVRIGGSSVLTELEAMSREGTGVGEQSRDAERGSVANLGAIWGPPPGKGATWRSQPGRVCVSRGGPGCS